MWLHPLDRKVQLIEVAVFLFLIMPSLATSFFIVNQLHLSFAMMAISSILNDLALVSLVLYLIWRNGEALQQIGWTLKSARREIVWGLLLFPPAVLGATLLENALHAAGLSAPTTLPSFLLATGLPKMLLAFILVTVVAVAEETVFRGYLLLRFKAVTGRSSAAVLLSAAIFSLGHGYEGMAGLISVFFLGVIFAFVYLWRQSLIAPVMIHFLIDFTSIVLLHPS
jgi:membrane protease YdiL (CAAX protease family)